MIKLCLENDYCNSCQNFEETVTTTKLIANNDFVEVNFYIKCKNRGLCRSIQNHLLKNMEVTKKDDK